MRSLILRRIGQHHVEPDIVRPRLDRGDACRFERDTHRERPGDQRREGTIVKAAAVTEPITVVIEAEAGNQQAVGLYDTTVGGNWNAVLSGPHRSERRPVMELEHLTGDDRQRGASTLVARKPRAHYWAQIRFTANWPEKPDRTNIRL